MENKRRNFLKITGLAGFGIVGSAANIMGDITPAYGAPVAVGEMSVEVLPPEDLAPLNRFPRMMQEYFVDRVRKIEQAGDKRRVALKTKADAEAYVRDVRNRIKNAFGPWPEKTPLNARVTGTLNRDGYTIEKVIFDSRPNFPVTASLYIPKGINGRMPGVIGTCGHGAGGVGKSSAAYQSFAQGLAKQGYVVLIFDPIGQGERIQYISKDLKPKHGVGTAEHISTGNQMVIAGESISTWFAWDGIRAIDYLLTRKEVDPKHIGVTGNSGGGTQTTWLCGNDPRITMAAPSCFVITLRRNLENENAADAEQCPAKILDYGLDHSDFIAAMAPRPVILLSQEKDFFDTRGTDEAFGRLKKLYRLLGAEQNIQLFTGPDYHGYSQPNREAMYGFFNKVTGRPNQGVEPVITIEKDETLWCTEKGQVGEFNAATVFSITSALSNAQEQMRPTKGNLFLQRAIVNALKLPKITHAVPDYRILRSGVERGYPKKHAATYAVETERNICTIVYRLDDNVLISRPPTGFKRAVLYISHLSADQELRQEPLIKNVIASENGAAIYAMDVRGIGESLPNTCAQDFFSHYGNDYFYAIHSLMLDKPYVGQKTFDVIRVLQWLRSAGHEEVHIVAKGWGTFPATFASLLSPVVKQVTLKHALTSYNQIAQSEDYNWPLSVFIPGVTKSFDLPDCYAALSSKNILQIEPTGAMARGLSK